MFAYLHPWCLSALRASIVKRHIKCQQNFYRVFSSEQQCHLFASLQVPTRTWNVLSIHRTNACCIGKALVVKKSPLLKESNVTNGSIDFSFCRTLYGSVYYHIDSGKQTCMGIQTNSWLRLTNMSDNAKLPDTALQNFENSPTVMCRYDAVDAEDINKINSISEITKSTSILKNEQCSLSNFADIYHKYKLKRKVNYNLQFLSKCPKRRRNVKKKSSLMFLVAGACLSCCKRSKDNENFSDVDSERNRKEQSDAELNVSLAADDVGTQTVTSVAENISAVAIKESQTLEPIITSTGNQKQLLTKELNGNLDEAFQNVTSSLENEEKSCQDVGTTNSEVLFVELPYCTSEPTSEERKRRKRRKRSRAQDRIKSKKGKRAVLDEEAEDGKIRKRPNYFVGIQVSNPEIHSAVKDVQNHIMKLEPNLKLAFINPFTLHITILVCHISDSIELKRACLALKESYDLLKEELSEKPLYMTFEGLGNFQNRVLFAELKGDETLQRLNDIHFHVKKCYEEHGLDLSGNKSLLKPHLTLAKLSKVRKPKQRVKKIEPSLYEEHKNVKFGIQQVKGLQLLSMAKKKDEKGYYHCEREFLFSVPDKKTSDIQGSYSKELNSALQKEKEVIRQRISFLSYKQLVQSNKTPMERENDSDSSASKCTDGKE